MTPPCCWGPSHPRPCNNPFGTTSGLPDAVQECSWRASFSLCGTCTSAGGTTPVPDPDPARGSLLLLSWWCCRFKFYRFDISVQLLDGPSILNYLVGLVGGQAPLASHTIHLAGRWAGAVGHARHVTLAVASAVLPAQCTLQCMVPAGPLS